MPTLRTALLVLLVAGAALAAGYGAALWWRPAPPAPETHQSPPTDFTLKDLNGRERRLSEWRGRPLLLNFWATWCAPCREEIPLFIEAQKRQAASGLEMVGIAIDRPQDAADFVTKFGIPYPVLLADDGTLDLMNRYGNPTGVLPYTVIFRADGTISHRKIGAFSPSDLENALVSLDSATP